ncbi:MAG TPA: 2Fe-2S iron-sulfur cluster-binding protein [Acidobacteriota bacterium]|nr:2Fe-2S iron-sulfur cluster-binding protein [Acidobacteriota bacterium]
MGKIIIDDKEFSVKDGERFVEEAESIGIPFGCTEGICGTCRVVVVEGGENLTAKTQEEIDFGLTDKERLACQCRLKGGCCRLKYD